MAPLPVWAQGFAGLGSDADGFAIPQRGQPLQFPRDHAPHPAFRIEWWYLTVTLTGADGQAYGVQWTLFRSGLEPNGEHLWMGHAALTSAKAHHSTERRARAGIGQAGVEAPLNAYIDDWYLCSTAQTGDAMDQIKVAASGPDFRYQLDLSATGPLVAHGDAGYSVKSDAGQASMYYSQPFFDASGTIETADGAVAVAGHGWLDREWSSQPLADNQTGWDWFSLSLDDGSKIMAFGLRASDGGHFTSGTWIYPDGTTDALNGDDVALTPLNYAKVQGRDVPVRWRVKIKGRNVDVQVSALRDDCWMQTSVPYWEGPVDVTGSHTGRGYLEMTGYE